ncbi:hypothetical protein OIU78_025343 [Salix suchowensis]|nr:hypothetical protein OIU78_025343 [Salix suchowensis]
MPEPEEVATPVATAPNTPGTPGGPLFSGLRVDSLSYSDRKIMPKCKCLPVNAPTWGQPHTCFLDFPAPDVSLTRKVTSPLSLIFILCLSFWTPMNASSSCSASTQTTPMMLILITRVLHIITSIVIGFDK